MKGRKKKRKRIRERDWDTRHEYAFSRDLAKHRKPERPEPVRSTAGVNEDIEANGVVVSHSGQWAFVDIDGQERLCLIDEGLVQGSSSLLAPGDEVAVNLEPVQPVVRGIATRRTKLSRPAGGPSGPREQVIAANVDLLVIVASASKPAFKPGLVDRYLVAAQVGGVDAMICLNKMDLVRREPRGMEMYRAMGVRIVTTSCTTGEGIEALRNALRGKLSVLAGHSGVGKSSILNQLGPGLDVETRTVSESTQKGRHATSSARLYKLEDSLRIIDTPGIRQLGLWGVSHEELDFYFPEIEERGVGCRFRDCSHTHEPDCAVRAAVDTGDIPLLRYESYLRIRESLQE